VADDEKSPSANRIESRKDRTKGEILVRKKREGETDGVSLTRLRSRKTTRGGKHDDRATERRQANERTEGKDWRRIDPEISRGSDGAILRKRGTETA